MDEHKKLAFLSYALSNRELAELVVPVIRAAGFGIVTTTAFGDMAPQQADAMRDSISRCDVAIMLVTPSAVRSQWLPFEIGMARAFDTPVIVLYDGLARDELPEYLQGFQIVGVSQVADVLKKVVADLKLAEA